MVRTRKWRCVVRNAPMGNGARPITMYPEEYGMTGAEAALVDAWTEIKSGLMQRYEPDEWLRRHPGVYVEMFYSPGDAQEAFRFRLVAFPSEGLMRYPDTFTEWTGEVREGIKAVSIPAEIVAVSAKYL